MSCGKCETCGCAGNKEADVYESPIALTTSGRAIMEADITTPRGRPGEIDSTVFIQDDTGFLDADGKQIVALSPIGRGLKEPVIHFAVPGDSEKE
jgi:hypothetical protein